MVILLFSLLSFSDKVLALKKKQQEAAAASSSSSSSGKATTPAPTGNEVSAGPVYEKNEVNGKFRIMEEFTEDLNDPSSEKYQKMSADIIRDGLTRGHRIRNGSYADQ